MGEGSAIQNMFFPLKDMKEENCHRGESEEDENEYCLKVLLLRGA